MNHDASSLAPRRRWRRRAGIALLLVIPGVMLAPWLTMLPPVRNAIAGRLSRETHLVIEFQRLSMGWLSSIKIRNITIRTAQGEPVAEIAEFRTRKNLLGLVSGPEKGVIEIKQPHVVLRLGEKHSNLQDVLQSLQKANPRAGLLGLLVHPDRDVHVQLQIQDASVSAQSARAAGQASEPPNAEPLAQESPQPPDPPGDVQGVDTAAEPPGPAVAANSIVSGVNTTLEIERNSGDLVVQLSPGKLLDRARVTRELCDFGLKYVAPILANATDIDGIVSLEFDAFRIPVSHLESAALAGRLDIETIQSEIQTPLLKRIAVTLGRLLNRPDPNRLHLADNSVVEFTSHDGRIFHTGLRFGLPKLSEELIIETDGSVGFDQSLDLGVHIPLPFELLGDAPLLQRLGGHTLHLTVRGTLDKPEIKLPSDGSLTAGLLGELVGGDEETTEALRQFVAGLRSAAASGLSELRERRQQKQAEPATEEEGVESSQSSAAGEASTGKGRLKRGLGRLLEKLKASAPPTPATDDDKSAIDQQP